MPDTAQSVVGSVAGLWRYPVKSMMGQELNAVEVTGRGLVGDRAYALVDSSDGKVATAKNPRKWPELFDYQAGFLAPPDAGADVPPVRITLPDGSHVTSEAGDCNVILSRALNRDVTIQAAMSQPKESSPSTSEAYWPDMEELDLRGTVTEFELPTGTFFDSSVLHLLTTATLERLRVLSPKGRFEIPRFRPNVVLETARGSGGFAENAWIGQTLFIGEQVRVSVTGPCSRCVMTTLPQGDLPRDLDILRTAVKHNQANIGVYASVVQGGIVHCGDSVRVGRRDAVA
jgi:uncharacterized protein YcbX